MKNLEDAKIALPSKLDSSQPPPLIQPLTCYNMDPYGFQKLTSEGVALSLKLQGPASTPLLSSHQAWILWTNTLHDFLSYNLHHSQVLFNTGPHHELTRACTAFERERVSYFRFQKAMHRVAVQQGRKIQGVGTELDYM